MEDGKRSNDPLSSVFVNLLSVLCPRTLPLSPGGGEGDLWPYEGVRHPHPYKFFAFDSHAPLEPFFVFGVPAVAMDWHGVEEFIAEDDSFE